MNNLQQLIDNGYYIVPITKGQKRPAVSKWQDLRIKDVSEIKPYTDKGCGIGILTGVGEYPVCGVDIDSMDEGLVKAFVGRYFADALIRVGKPPKSLMLFRTDKPYSKMVSGKFEDAEGDVHRLELLGSGQQFVAYGVHPDTKKKYVWGGLGPANISVENLPILEEKDLHEMLEQFELLAINKGLKPPAATTSRKEATGDSSLDILMNYEPNAGLSTKECLKVLETLDPDDYDLWIKVGMALHHEFNGEGQGFDLWNAWSSAGGTYQGASDLRFRWKGFGHKGRAPLTMRSVVAEAKEVKKEEIRAEKRDLQADMQKLTWSCTDAHQLIDEIAPKLGAIAKDDIVLGVEAEKLIKDHFRKLSGALMSAKDVRKAIAKGKDKSLSVKANGDEPRGPEWVRGWVYVSESNQFFSMTTGVSLDVQGFRGLFDAEMEDEGGNAAMWVLNNDMVPKADRRMYVPGAGPLFKMDGVRYANTYSTKGAADLDGELCEEGSSEVFEQHIKLMIGGGEWTREAHLFTNFLRYVLEYPGKRMTWAVLLQGAYGDGKSEPITRLMGRLLGRKNVRIIQAQTIESDKFNGWAEGHLFGIIEEIKLHGHNRYDILNKLKPIITNDVIEIRRMRTDSYSAPNTGNYYITTNYKDALPIVAGDRRYMILFSQFPEEYRNNIGYFNKLFKAIGSDTGVRAIGKWLLSVEYHKDFKPQSHAPYTEAKGQATELSQDTVLDDIERLLEESDSPLFCEDYIVYGPFKDILCHMGLLNTKGNISDRVLGKHIFDLGFEYAGRKRVGGHRERIWAKKTNPQFFAEKYEERKLIC